MNLANSYNQEHEIDYQVEPERRGGKDKTVRDRKMQYSRSSRPAVRFVTFGRSASKSST